MGGRRAFTVQTESADRQLRPTATNRRTDLTPALLTEATEDGVLIATLNRPDKLNAINRETMDLLTEAVLRFRDTPSSRSC